jgi:DNA-binding MltR family transcriptional regulator
VSVSQRRALDALNRLTNQRPDSDELFSILQSIMRGPEHPHLPKLNLDHTAAIMGASILENALEAAILRKLVTLTSQEQSLVFREGPLSAFTAKIRVGHALGIYGSGMKDDLLSIKAVRNVFAHAHTHVDFGTQEIVDLCSTFSILNKEDLWPSPEFPRPVKARDEYLASIRHYYICLAVEPEDEEDLREIYKAIAF